MISFERNVQELRVCVDSETGVERSVYVFTCHFSNEATAAIVRDYLHEKLNGKLCLMREEAYNQGWKDAKAKKAKTKWFSRWWK
jgi:hypothetical protein